MADKELKDWCKTCNVEPPAMKFKCPECEHNPDKEQIIVDGVDVMECDNYYIEQETDQVKCDNDARYCREHKNYLFKQLARKTQIVEQQHKTIDELIGCVSLWEEFTEEESKLAKDSSIADLIMLLRKKTQECEKYFKQRNNILEECKRYQEEIGKLQKSQFCVAYEKDCHKVQEYKNKILDIISGFADGRSKASPDSEQIEHTAAKPQMRNSVSVEQIQDNKAKGGEDERF